MKCNEKCSYCKKGRCIATFCPLEHKAKGEAIPIEWIEKKCRELYEHLYLDESLGVQMLLRDWEKENEID